MIYKILSFILTLSVMLFVFGCSSKSELIDVSVSENAPITVSEPSSIPAVEESLVPKQVERVSSITPQFSKRITEKKNENPDTIGWLFVPGTSIDSTIVQNPKYDNNYYLTHDFNGNISKTATFSTDWRCDFTSGLRQDIPNNIALFGHSFSENPDDELFSQIKKYRDPEFAQANPYIFFSTADEDMVWEVFAVFTTTVNLPYIAPNLDWNTLSDVIEVICDASIYDYGVTITENDKLLVLSCCTYSIPGKEPLPIDIPNDYRFAVMARLAAPDEPVKESASFTVNDTPLHPDEIPTIYHPQTDIFMQGGFIYLNASSFYKINPTDISSGILLGEIKRTGITRNLQDWDAILLNSGTQILQHPNDNEILIALVDGVATPYMKYE